MDASLGLTPAPREALLAVIAQQQAAIVGAVHQVARKSQPGLERIVDRIRARPVVHALRHLARPGPRPPRVLP